MSSLLVMDLTLGGTKQVLDTNPGRLYGTLCNNQKKKKQHDLNALNLKRLTKFSRSICMSQN